LRGEHRSPYDRVKAEQEAGGEFRPIPPLIYDCWICDRLHISMAELNNLPVQQVWLQLGYLRGRELGEYTRLK
jgi:hypothetical protein